MKSLIDDIDKEGQIYRGKMKAGMAEKTAGIAPNIKLDVSLKRSTFKDNDENVKRDKTTNGLLYFNL